MSGIGVINNPHSRQNVRNPDRIRRLGYILGESGESRATGTFDELEDVLHAFKKQKIDILAINGGDGSNHVTITKLIKIYDGQDLPMIALLRGGTLNTISAAFDIKGKPPYILHNVSRKYAEGRPFKIKEADLMNVNGSYSFLFGNGIVANFMKTYYDTGKPSPSHGVKVLAKGVASALTGGKLAREWFRKIDARVTVDGERLPITAFTSMLAGGMTDIGVGFKPWTRAFDVPRRFHILFFDCSPLKILPQIPYIYFAQAMHPVLGEERMAEHVHIEADEPFGYTQDGDMYTCEDGVMDISVGPRVRIIVE